jgi:membrane fusion protein (multidrug efflux system)
MSALQTDTAQYAAGLREPRGLSWDFLGRLRTDRALLRRVLMIGGVALVVVVSLALWLTGGRYVGTDDSYVHAAQLNVSTDVSGLVKDVDVHEGQTVRKGDVLFRIDPLQFQIALANAKANLVQQTLTLIDERRLSAHAARCRRASRRRWRSTR